MTDKTVNFARKVLVTGSGVLAALVVFAVLGSLGSDSSPAAVPAADDVLDGLRRDHEPIPVVDSVTTDTFTLEDGRVIDVIEDFVLPDGSVVSGKETALEDPADPTSPEATSPATSPSTSTPPPTSTVSPPPSTAPTRDRVEEIKTNTVWPTHPSLSGASYLGSYWNIVDVPEDGVLLVTKVHEWVFTPGDETAAASIVSQLESRGWAGLAGSKDGEGTYGAVSDSIPGCGDGMDCSLMVRTYSGEVILLLENTRS